MNRAPNKEPTDHIVVFGHSSLVYWWPVWLVCFILAGLTYTEGDRSGGVTVSHSDLPGVFCVIPLLTIAVSGTVILRGIVSVIAAITLVALMVVLAWFWLSLGRGLSPNEFGDPRVAA